MNKIYYEITSVKINGERVDAKVTDVKTQFQLTQCLCSCSMILDAHYEDCPNAIGRIVGRVIKRDGIEEVLWEY